MILVPEIQAIVLLVPKAASGSIYRAVKARYPKAIHLYRHMEADGVPAGYDRWQKVGVVREPVARLWSLYKFLKDFRNSYADTPGGIYEKTMRASVEMPFSEWILENRIPFTTPYSSEGSERFHPFFTVRHAVPENRKSQFVYLRPDLGTKVYRHDELADLESRLDIRLGMANVGPAVGRPALTAEAIDHVRRFFAWDIEASCGHQTGSFQLP